MLTAARRECCTQGDAHGRRLGVLSTILPPRPGRRTHCAGTGGVATLPRAVPRNVLRPPALRRAPRSGLLASPQHPVQHIVVSFRRPKHLFHMRAATGALSTNPATAPPPAKLFCSVLRSHNHFGERRGAGSESSGTDTHFFGRQRRRETLQSPVRLREPF